MQLELAVKFKGSVLTVRLPAEAPVSRLQEELAGLTGVNPASQKLIYKGRCCSPLCCR